MSYTMPLFAPKSEWRHVKTPPDLSGVRTLGIDTEGYDPNLNQRGPGGIRRDGHVAGFSIATKDKGWYVPLRHVGGDNVPDPSPWIRWLRDLGKDPNVTWIGANIGYDIEWLSTLNVSLGAGKFIDIQLVEALIDEEQESYELDVIAKKYLGEGKREDLLREAANAHGLHEKKGLWQMPARYVGPYAEFDAVSVMRIFECQFNILREQDLQQVFTLEMNLIRIMWEMRKQGIPVDLEAAAKLRNELHMQEEDLRYQAWKEHGCKLDEWSGDLIANMCDQLKIPYPRTPKGNPSFEGEWLDRHPHPFLQKVAKVRELNRLRGAFIDDWIFKHEIDGWIHPQWKQLKRDDGGTRTGRMAASNPNPQQVPGRSEVGHLLRSLFKAPAGTKWAKLDYSQQEPRLAVHFACLCKCPGADLIKVAYRDNARMDIYQFLADAARVTRKEAKDITLGRFYGMGAAKMAAKLNVTVERAQELLGAFDNYVPFIRELSDTCAAKARERGWIRTLCGRKRHFNWWEPCRALDMRREGKNTMPVRTREDAEAVWPKERVRRAFTHKALNSLIQGSAADMTKSAMLQVYCELGKVPYMQVHDELNYGVANEDEALTLKHVLENCVKLQVPIIADLSVGDTWK